VPIVPGEVAFLLAGLLVALTAAGWWLRRRRRLAVTSVARPPFEFHVENDAAVIVFAVPVPGEGADPVLRDLLLHHAAGILRDKKRSQPLQGIDVAVVYGKAGPDRVEVGRVDMRRPAHLDELEMPQLLPRGAGDEIDPLRHLDETDEHAVMPLAAGGERDSLPPIREELRLTAGLDAGLRSLGIDPATMTVAELGRGLLTLLGYGIEHTASGHHVATRHGVRTYLSFVDHQPGGYPELGEGEISSFLIGFAAARCDRGLLLTDKYGPYRIYEKERANPKCRFVTRERLQGFVDSVALGS
jgi:hypothetical protein